MASGGFMKKISVNTRYLIVPIMSLATVAGIIAGGIYVWTGVILFGANTLIDILTRDIHHRADFDSDGQSYGIKKFQYGVMYFMLPVFISFQLALAWQIHGYVSETSGALSLTHLIGATLSAALWAGLGIIYGHELSHNRKEGFFVSRLIMALSGASHFTYAHVYNHHLDLGHEDDPATAPRGRNVYAHAWHSHMGQSNYSYDMESRKAKANQKSFFNSDNRWLIGYLFSLPTIVLFVWAGGLWGVAAILVIWGVSNFLLEALNFMGHYGLIREAGRPVEHRHSWDNDNVFTSWFFIEIGRQCDHHVRGETYFWELDDVNGPNYGIGYFELFLYTLVPPLFRKFVQKHLDNWDKNYATEAEREIARRFTSCEGSPNLLPV